MSDPVLSSMVPPPIPDRSKLGMASMVLGLFALIAATAGIIDPGRDGAESGSNSN